MYKVSTSVYVYTGDATATLNTLTNVTSVTSNTLADVSTNYPSSVPNQSAPNADNQSIFMNQPMTGWVEGLNSSSVKYAPVSNYVNWAYTENSNVYHIGMPISDYLIPNSIASSILDPETKVITHTYVMKFGMSKVETLVSPVLSPPV